MQTIIIIIVVVVGIIILIIILIVWFGHIYFFFSIHRRKGSYLAYLINWTIFLYIWKIFVLLSSAGLFPWCTNGPTIQSHTVRSKAFYSHIYKQIFLVTRFKEKKGNRQCAALGFPPSDEVIQELSGVEHCRLLSDQDKETKSHERSTWRLRTPTICRRSVPALCNAGLPKKKTLQQGKINKKTN